MNIMDLFFGYNKLAKAFNEPREHEVSRDNRRAMARAKKKSRIVAKQSRRANR